MRVSRCLALVVLLGAGECPQCGSSTTGIDPVCATIAYVSGADQIGHVGGELPAPFVVRVYENCSTSTPDSDVPVAWVVTQGGGTMRIESGCGSYPAHWVVSCTDADGRTRGWYTPGPLLGTHIIRASRLGGVSTGNSTVTLGVDTESPRLAFSLSPSSLTLTRGSSADVDVTIHRQGAVGDVELRLESTTGVVWWSFAPPTASGASARLTLSARDDAPLGTFTLVVSGQSGDISGHGPVTSGGTNLTLHIVEPPPPDVIVLSVSPSRLEIEQGGQATVAVTIERDGDPGDVTLSITDVAGVLQSFSFAPNPAPAGSSILTLQIGDRAEPGEHTLTVTGTAGSATASVDVDLDITRPPGQEHCVVFDAGSSWLQGWDDDYVPGRTSGTGLAYTVEERETGGNPGSFRHVTLTMGQNSGIWVQHRHENAVWRPATDGPVDRIVAEVDVRSVPPSSGEALSSFMLIQNETVYWTERVRVRDADGWVRASWNETDFVKFGTGPGGNQPDFSAQGTPIQFGYLTGSSHTTGAASATRHNGADNWRAEVCTGSS